MMPSPTFRDFSKALLAGCCLLFSADAYHLGAEQSSQRIPVVPRPRRMETVIEWSGNRIVEQWRPVHECRLELRGNCAVVSSTGEDPYVVVRHDARPGHYELLVEYRAEPSLRGALSVYWATSAEPFGEGRRRSRPIIGDRKWHAARIEFETGPSPLTRLRIDPGSSTGTFLIRRIALRRIRIHPLRVTAASVGRQSARFLVANASPKSVGFRAGDQRYVLPSDGEIEIAMPLARDRAVTTTSLVIDVPGWPEIRRSISAYSDDAREPWLTQTVAGGTWEIARDGSVARLRRMGQTVLALAPLVLDSDRIVRGVLENSGSSAWHFASDGARWRLRVEGGAIHVEIMGDRDLEGPVVRAFGELEQGLLAGVEYLGKNERSSSKLDIETEEHIRFAPDVRDVTMPLMAFVTDRGSVAMRWEEMGCQPVYATPNFIDATEDHRMALRGRTIRADIRYSRRRLEDQILWCVRERGFPDPPPAPRSPLEQRALDLKGLRVIQVGESAWRHAKGDRWQPRPFADMASTLWKITGKLPSATTWQPGGAHLPNHSVFFLSGQGARWERWLRARAQQLMAQQEDDGSFRYRGKYARGHFEDTASGYCAVRATQLLETAWLLDDRESLAAGLRTLEFMRRFRTPRGAQTWECPLHTPDLLASAYLVWAYVRGYELTGDESYLREARRWALSGLPFLYQWSDRPIMAYATTPVLGATNWTAPNWIGRPVQWVGIVYGYALTLLSPYEKTLDWNRIALGILRTSRQMQYPDGSSAGLLPDAFDLESQMRLPADINPCSMLSLQLRLEGKIDSVSVLRRDALHAVSAFPMRLEGTMLTIDGPAGHTYMLRMNGKWLEIHSQGVDRVETARPQ